MLSGGNVLKVRQHLVIAPITLWKYEILQYQTPSEGLGLVFYDMFFCD